VKLLYSILGLFVGWPLLLMGGVVLGILIYGSLLVISELLEVLWQDYPVEQQPRY